ncbi:phosphatases II [Lentithecium fluviatile CBS 122367]|uniref:protein-tyrosine-phosphatase n=1 Tax=Lentithecium fluviatile CBS 122367 TaxID=1168545 RepID=A0A6G1J6K8_9PLEO|nr:phosphatases II [Lentithecium fluviatile CBS 122367]
MNIFQVEAISAIQEVPGLYISDISVPRKPEVLREHGITHVLSLTSRRDRPEIARELGIEQLHVEIEDNPFEDLLLALEGACAWIDNALNTDRAATATDDPSNRIGERGAKGNATLPASRADAQSNQTAENRDDSRGSAVLVHCLQGISRSGAIIVAYLMRSKALDYEAALALAQRSRAIITPNSGFVDQLRLWAQMRYTIYRAEAADGSPDERKAKAEYEAWKENRGILLSRGEEAKQQATRKSMADMAAKFGRRRLKLKEEEE